MRSPADSLLAALVTTTVVVTAALGWAGWRLLDQQRALDDQRARDRADSTADAIAADVRGVLAGAGERLSGWVSNPSTTVPAIAGSVVIAVHRGRTHLNPHGGLPFLPVAGEGRVEAFAALETVEFLGDGPRAAAGYRALAGHRDPVVQAGALLRLARVQRKLGDPSGAVATYERLKGFGAVRVGDLPAELAGLTGQHSTYLAMPDPRQAEVVAASVLRGLDAGRWAITRGTAEHYREPFPEPRPASWALAHALSEVWDGEQGHLPARGHRVFAAPRPNAASVLVLWRSNGEATAALAAFADAFFGSPPATAAAWQLVDAEGRVITGRAGDRGRSVSRIVGDYPWTLHAWVEPSAIAGATRTRAILLVMMGAMLAFVWGAAYFMARAIRSEAAVARLRSDFVAAVSHEFRSPLTAIRQMAEMLAADRVPGEERRHTYYGALAGEAARLQRLVETLLNFGRMEAGAARYRVVDLDAGALVRDVVEDIAPHARELGKAIEIDGAEPGVRLRADKGALSVALRNLIDNAIKYSPGEPTVWVRWRQEEGRAAICVVDRGVGIPQSEQRSVFDTFVRGRAAVDANIRGTGVGLAIVQQIVTAHGGEIRLESEPGRGSTFTLLLPAAG